MARIDTSAIPGPGIASDATVASLVSNPGSSTRAALGAAFGLFANVKSYGAKVDGTTDDAAAITAAIASLGSRGGIVFVPAGVTAVGSTITVPSNVRVIGAGKNATVIKKTFNGVLFDFSGTDTSHRCQRGGMADVQLNGGQNTTGPLVRTQYADHLNFDRVWFYQNNDSAIVATELWDSYFVGCEFEWCGTPTWRTGAVVRLLGSATDSTNEIYFVQCRWESFPANALFVDSNGTSHPPYGIWLSQCKMESNHVNAAGSGYIETTNDIADVHIRDIYLAAGALESGGTAAVLIQLVASANMTVEGVHAWINGGAASSVIRVFSGQLGHAIRDVFVDAATAPANGIIDFAGGNPLMRVANVRYKAGQSGTVYNGAIPGGVVLDDSGRVLTSVKYDPTTYTQKTTTSTTMTALDTTNLAVTFTAPTSGKVIVRLSALAGAAGAVNLYWGLLNASGGAEVARGTAGFYSAASGGDVRTTMPLVVSGLTPGTSYTYRWAQAVNAAVVGRTTYGDGPAGNPAVMEVIAA